MSANKFKINDRVNHKYLKQGRIVGFWIYGSRVRFDDGVPLGYNCGRNPCAVFEDHLTLIQRPERRGEK